MSSMKKVLVLTILIVGAWTAFSSCRHERLNKKKVVAVSIEPLRYFAEQIAGGRFEIVSVVPSGYSPETYEPTPEQLFSVSEAAAYMKVGRLGFETTWLEKISRNEPNLRVFDTSINIGKRTSGLNSATFDPHTWTSPHNAGIICQNICEAFCSIDSTGRQTYKQNLHRLLERINNVDASIRAILKNLQNRTFVTAHPTLTYFADDYGLKQLSIEKNGKEPTPAELSEFILRCKQENVKTILIQPEFSHASATVLGQEIGAKVIGINPLSYHWDLEMLKTAKALTGGRTME